MRLITRDDLSETIAKINQRGSAYILSKFTANALARTQSTFDDVHLQASNWWIIPAVRARWNEKITGRPELPYEPYVVNRYLRDKRDLHLLSLGSGACGHEMAFARHPQFGLIECVDITPGLLRQAETQAREQGLHNMRFEVRDVNAMPWPEATYDIVFFHAALHHFRNVPAVVAGVHRALRPGGLLIFNDYVGPNRLQWTAAQLSATNELLRQLPVAYRQRFMSRRIKTQVSGPGWLRMLISDPSEAVESELIRPAVHRHFRVLEEKAIGGNLLTLVLKDIAHHFLGEDATTQTLLRELFAAEDRFLEKEPSDLLFGVYQKDS
jgi:ubiquinone/menaquinone biosynthesis C-methylase UbiE